MLSFGSYRYLGPGPRCSPPDPPGVSAPVLGALLSVPQPDVPSPGQTSEESRSSAAGGQVSLPRVVLGIPRRLGPPRRLSPPQPWLLPGLLPGLLPRFPPGLRGRLPRDVAQRGRLQAAPVLQPLCSHAAVQIFRRSRGEIFQPHDAAGPVGLTAACYRQGHAHTMTDTPTL